MKQRQKLFIGGKWKEPNSNERLEVINPSDESILAEISIANAQDVSKAVQAAKDAFSSYSAFTVQERKDLLDVIIAVYDKRAEDIAEAISLEMGAPIWLSRSAQTAMGKAHLREARKILDSFEFIRQQKTTAIAYEPIGVVGMITPWNWPINQIACKVAPALAAGCTMVLKPSELSPLSAMIFAEVLEEAGVPAGVFNLVNGDGATTGAELVAHPDVDMVSFTGSTSAGIAVAKAAAPTIKRVAQELGGKSAYIVIEDADLERSIKSCLNGCFLNSGQNCNAPTRLLVPKHLEEQALTLLKNLAERYVVEQAIAADGRQLGPVVSKGQFDRIQGFLDIAVKEGARILVGGAGRAEGFDKGYFVKPTVVVDVTPEMEIAREEVFGPVLAVLSYENLDEAIAIANDSRYGLSAYVDSGSLETAREVALKLRTGMVHLNGAMPDISAPFGGYKRSGNGREWGVHGFKEYLEVKSLMGYYPHEK